MATSLNHSMSCVQLRDPVRQQHSASVLLMVMTMAVAASLAIPVFWVVATEPLGRALTIAALTLNALCACASILLVRQGHFRRGVQVITVAMLVAMAIMLSINGLSGGGAVMFALAIPITFSGLVSGPGLLVFTSITSFLIVTLVAKLQPQLHQIFNYQPFPPTSITVAVFLLAVVVLAFFVNHFSTSLSNALRSAHTRAQELERLQTSLEKMVTVRTAELQVALETVEQREKILSQLLNELSASEARQRAMLNAIPDMMYRIRRDGLCFDYKDNPESSTHAPISPTIAQRAEHVFEPVFAQRVMQRSAEVFDTNVVQIFEQQISINNTVRDMEIRIVPCTYDEVLCIVRDISERKKIERMKNEFVAVVSHELRTPLTSIRGALGLVAGGVAGTIPTSAKAMLEIAHKNSERLVRLINDMLDIEKIESGKMQFDLQPLHIQPLIERAVADNQAYAQQLGVVLEVVPPVLNSEVLGDSDRLLQVMANLLSNAAKFSPHGGVVQVAAARHGQNVRIAVIDQGEGIPEAFQGQIFQKFAQADSSDTGHKGGTGLGLSISKAIVECCGGSIGFTSSPGGGTTFYVDLPIHADSTDSGALLDTAP